jgi:hypothetical protein
MLGIMVTAPLIDRSAAATVARHCRMAARVAHRRLQPALHRRRVRIRNRGENLRGVIGEMDKPYPGLGHHLEEEMTVAIDGQIQRPLISSQSARAARSSSSSNSKGGNNAAESSG